MSKPTGPRRANVGTRNGQTCSSSGAAPMRHAMPSANYINGQQTRTVLPNTVPQQPHKTEERADTTLVNVPALHVRPIHPACCSLRSALVASLRCLPTVNAAVAHNLLGTCLAAPPPPMQNYVKPQAHASLVSSPVALATSSAPTRWHCSRDGPAPCAPTLSHALHPRAPPPPTPARNPRRPR